MISSKLVQRVIALGFTWSLIFSQAAYCENFSPAFLKGKEYIYNGQYDSALEQLTKARSQDPRDPATRELLAGLYKKLHRFEEAEIEYQALLSLSPNNLTHEIDFAQLLMDEGKFSDAQNIYQQILSRHPDNSKALLGLAMALESSGYMDTAMDYYQQVVRKFPSSQEASFAQERIPKVDNAQVAERSHKFFPIDPEIGEEGFGWWNLKKMPLRVYIDSGAECQGYRDTMRQSVVKALEEWNQASHGVIEFELLMPNSSEESTWNKQNENKPVLERIVKNISDMPSDPVNCEIHVHWTDNMSGALGLAWTNRMQDGSPVLSKAHLWISTNRLADNSIIPDKLTAATQEIFAAQDRMLDEVALHELGHVLGLPHSVNSNDIMSAGIYGYNATDMVNKRQLTYRDKASLSEHYSDFSGTGMPFKVIANLQEEDIFDEAKSGDFPTGAFGGHQNYGPGGPGQSSDESPFPPGAFGGGQSYGPGGPVPGAGGDNFPTSAFGGSQSYGPGGPTPIAQTDGGSGGDSGTTGTTPTGGAAGATAGTPANAPAGIDPKDLTDEQKAILEEQKKFAEEQQKAEAETKKAEEEERKAQEALKKEEEEQKKAEGDKKGDKKEEDKKILPYDPLREVIVEMNARDYTRALQRLDELIGKDPHQAKAIYLRAIVHVHRRQYHLAAKDYREVIKLAPDTDLAVRAQDGLKKINF